MTGFVLHHRTHTLEKGQYTAGIPGTRPLRGRVADRGLNGHRKGRRCVWLAATNGNSKQKKGEASCTCSDPRGSSTMAKQGAADASQKPIDPSSLSITRLAAEGECLKGQHLQPVFMVISVTIPRISLVVVQAALRRVRLAARHTRRPSKSLRICVDPTCDEICGGCLQQTVCPGHTRGCAGRYTGETAADEIQLKCFTCK